jgi:predicted DNA-binding protein (UPF0251 family)
MKKVKKGQELPQTRLNEQSIRAIRYAVEKEDMAMSDAADLWEVTRMHIWRIVNRKAWAHVR